MVHRVFPSNEVYRGNGGSRRAGPSEDQILIALQKPVDSSQPSG
jgi:hypothetical protein